VEHDPAATGSAAAAALLVVAAFGDPVAGLGLFMQGAALGSFIGGAIALRRKKDDPEYDTWRLVTRWGLTGAIIWTVVVTIARGVA
jgi:hypothetical protein